MSKVGRIITLDQEWRRGGKRQMEVDQGLPRRRGFEASPARYFVSCNARIVRRDAPPA